MSRFNLETAVGRIGVCDFWGLRQSCGIAGMTKQFVSNRAGVRRDLINRQLVSPEHNSITRYRIETAKIDAQAVH